MHKHFGQRKMQLRMGNLILDAIIFNPKYFREILFNMHKLRVAGGKGIRFF